MEKKKTNPMHGANVNGTHEEKHAEKSKNEGNPKCWKTRNKMFDTTDGGGQVGVKRDVSRSCSRQRRQKFRIKVRKETEKNKRKTYREKSKQETQSMYVIGQGAPDFEGRCHKFKFLKVLT